jgi:hypothetical protein
VQVFDDIGISTGSLIAMYPMLVDESTLLI